MNNKVINIIAFVAGAGIGSAATWYFLKEKFEKQYQEEINSVKNALFKKYDALNTKEDVDVKKETVPQFAKEDKEQYSKIVKQYDYTQFAQNREEALSEPEEVEEKVSGPYIISPDMYDESDYDTVSLTYYADDVLADSISDEVYDDPYSLVGEFKSHFGEYDDDSVFVRNDDERLDYEIIRDDRRYSDVAGRKYSSVANQDFD